MSDSPSRRPRASHWRAFLALCLLACAALAHAASAPPEAALRVTLDRHLAAINARDLDGLLATVTDGDALTLILPDGRVLATRADYRRLHVDWFAERDWRMVFDVEDVRVFGDVGIARVRYDSQSRDAGGAYVSRRVARLSLVFARERGEWRLVYDQNTPIPDGTPPDRAPPNTASP